MNSKTKSTLLLVLLTITFIICSTLVLAISFKNSESNEAYADTHNHTGWTAWSNSSSLPTSAGSYYLTTDVTVGKWNVPTGTMNLCLNNHVITLTSYEGIEIQSNSVFNLYDEPSTTRYWIDTATEWYCHWGRIASQSEYNTYSGNKGTFVGGCVVNTVNNVNDNPYKRIFRQQGGSTFNMYGGTLMGAQDGGVYVYNSGATINIYDGNFIANTNAIKLDSINYNVSFYGGKISGNYNGINGNSKDGNIALNGGDISDNYCAVRGRNIILNGTVIKNNTTDFYMYDVGSNVRTLTLMQPLTEGTVFKVNSPNGVFTKDWTTYMGNANPIDYFTSTRTKTIIEKEGDEVAVKQTYTLTYDANGASGDVPASADYISGRTATVAGNTGNLQKTGKYFGGWNTQADGTGDSYFADDSLTVTADTTLYANWVSAMPPTINGTTGATVTYGYESQNISVSATPAEGHTLSYQWYDNGTTNNNNGGTIIDGATNASYAFPIGKNAGTYYYYCVVTATYNNETATVKTSPIAVTVNKANPNYEIPTGLVATYGQTLADIVLSNGWAWDDNTTDVGIVGSHDFAATFTPVDTDNYNLVEQNLTVMVNKADPAYTAPTGLQATYGDLLSSVTLTNGWTWKTVTNTVGNVGEREHIAIFTPEDTTNFNTIEESLTITVAKANPTYTVPTNIEAPYGATLSIVVLPEGFTWMDGTQKVDNWEANTFKAKYTPTDTANYNVIENIDVQVVIKWIIVDPDQDTVNVEIDDGETNFDVSITVKVEVKTELSVEAKQTNYANLAKGFVAKDEDISAIYGVKLIRTTNGVEEEIQPSDIKEGQKIKISMAIPEALQGKEFRLLHIHSAEDISEVSKEHYAISANGKTLIIETDKLSEFAFVSKTDKADNGFIYDEPSSGFKYWWIIVVVAVVLIICLLLFIFFKRKKDNDDDSNKTNEQPEVEDDSIDEDTIAQTEAEAEKELEDAKEDTIESIEAKEEITLKDSITLAKATASSHTFSKKYVADYLRTKDIVEVNERENFTKTGLPLADTHYVDGKDGKKCFAYVYETEGSIILLAKMDDAYAKSLQKKHSQINKSAFPKQKNTWYSLIIDDTYTKEEFEDILDELIGEVKEDAGMSLKESIALAKASTAHSFSKKYVCEYLQDKKDVVVNTRENYTRTGLPLADTHYVIKGDKKICFAYIYEIEGSIILLAKMNAQYAKELQKKHSNVTLSAFPKQADTWYSLIIDDTYSKEEFEKILDDIREQA